MRANKTQRLLLFLVVLLLTIICASSSTGTRVGRASSASPSPRPAVVAATAAASGDGGSIEYKSFSGATYQLRAFNGRYVRYTLPDAWLGQNGLSREEVDALVDLTDLAYAHISPTGRACARGG